MKLDGGLLRRCFDGAGCGIRDKGEGIMRGRFAVTGGIVVLWGLWSASIAWAAAPVNNTFSGATPVVVPSSTSEDTSSATAGKADPTDCFSSGATVWFSYAATADQTLQADTVGSSYGTSLEVVTGSPGAFADLGCTGGNFPNGQSAVRFDAHQGQTYYFVVGACCYDPSLRGGNLTFNLAAAAPPVTVTGFTVNGRATLNRAGGIITVSGTYVCSSTALGASTDVSGAVNEVFGHQFASGSFDTGWMPCATTPTAWSAQVFPGGSVAFGSGQASLQASDTTCDAFTCDGRNTARLIRIR
jgi:hypothetical protein